MVPRGRHTHRSGAVELAEVLEPGGSAVVVLRVYR